LIIVLGKLYIRQINKKLKKTIYKIVDGKKSSFNYFREIIDSKFVIYEFFKRDIKILYAQSVIGPIFYIILPLLQTGVFNFFINKIFGNGLDFATSFLIIFINMVFWNLFSQNTIKGASILILNIKLINKVYIPRLIFFISPYFVSLVHFLIQFVSFILLLFYFNSQNDLVFLNIQDFSKWILVIPLLIYCFFLYFSLAVIISMLSIRYRDIVHLIGYAFQLGLFISPVLYSLSDLSGLSYTLVALNPYSFVPEILRWIFFENTLNLNFLLINLFTTFFLFLLSIFLFIKKEKYIADLI